MRAFALLALFLAAAACTEVARDSVRRIGPEPAREGGTGLGIVGVIDAGGPTVAGLAVVVDDTVPVSLDGATASLDDAQPGMVAVVEARDTSRGVLADSVALRSEVSGPVSSVDIARSEIVILGQTVRVTAATVQDGRIPTLAALASRQWLRVSGLRDGAGVIVATRLDRRESGVAVVRGTAAGVIGNAFRIGPLPVEANTLPRDLVDGRTVEAVGTPTADGLRAVRVMLEPREPFGGRLPRAVIEGYAQATGVPGQVLVGPFAIELAAGPLPDATHVIADAIRDPAGRWVAAALQRAAP